MPLVSRFAICWLLTVGGYSLADEAQDKQGQFGIGIKLEYSLGGFAHTGWIDTLPLEPEISFWGNYRFNNGIFWETPKSNEFGLSNLILGYDLWQNDFIDVSLVHTLMNPLPVYDYHRNESSQVVTLDRFGSFMFGARVQAYSNSIALSGLLAIDPFVTRGLYGSVKAGYPFRLGNWYAMPGLSVSMTSAQLNQRYIGLNAAERPKLAFLPDYNAPTTVDWGAGIGFTYPISQRWLLDIYAEQIWYHQGFKESPLVQDIQQGKAIDTFVSGVMFSYVW